MYGKNKPYQNPEPLPTMSRESLPKIESPKVSVSAIIFFTILIFLGLFLYLNREKVYDVFKKMLADFSPSKEIDKAEERYHALVKDLSNHSEKDILKTEKARLDSMEQKQNRILDLLEKPITIESKEKDKKEETKKEESSGMGKLNERISGYCKNQMVTSNGFCYIGYDKNQRECTSVSDGDICMSGQVFPTMDVCLYPKLRP
jgi:hypothetical protein